MWAARVQMVIKLICTGHYFVIRADKNLLIIEAILIQPTTLNQAHF